MPLKNRTSIIILLFPYRTMDMVEHSVLMLCAYLPGTISDKCIDFVQTYGDEIIDQIVHEEMDPKQVCTALTLCGPQTWGNDNNVFNIYYTKAEKFSVLCFML